MIDERRPEQDRVAVDPVRVARPRVDEDAGVARRADDALRQAGGARERPPRLAVRDQLEPDHQPPAADLADVLGCGAEPLVEQVREPLALVPARLDEVLLVEDPEDLAGDGGAGRRVRVREAVDEAAGADDGVVDRARRRDEPERPVARRRALGGDEDVGA